MWWHREQVTRRTEPRYRMVGVGRRGPFLGSSAPREVSRAQCSRGFRGQAARPGCSLRPAQLGRGASLRQGS